MTQKNQQKPVIIDGATLTGAHDLSLLFGAPAGYINHGEPGILDVARTTGAPAVFDEFSKADPTVRVTIAETGPNGDLQVRETIKLPDDRTFSTRGMSFTFKP